MGSSITIVASVAACISATAALIGQWLSHRAAKEAQGTQDEMAEFQILKGTVETLNTEVERLSRSLDTANTKADRLNHELEAAQANVMILSDHIRQYLPEVPFPRLRRMTDMGGKRQAANGG